ncbi:transcriptional regulatory protein YpdB [Oxobacter pfennigii]|uniref:Stage 0 sporulation protein A homolog n=1 Tax=Oxobacter pfennigii TaxID=36849 RepID=A0A0P8W7W1_9CLOT|nr:LytTR family DNA-binding domain-containing protein [Oxobacter pfennigii]KPU44756.1 transcriptional regulatory protein YpdB [Oxobacter pfennigii]
MRHIILVEDEDSSVMLIRQFIKELSSEHTLTVFSKASEALHYARNNRIDLFILDIQLLDYRGTILAKQLRSIPEYKFTPILFTTELAGEELDAYREIKCYAFLVKPFNKNEFQDAFRDALSMGERMQSLPETLRIEQKQFIFEYEIRDILYIESFGKRIVIHTWRDQNTEGTDTISGYSLAKLLTLIGADKLIQCHKSFLVNPDWILKIDKVTRLLYLKHCKAEIHIGEKYQQNLLRREKP